MKTRFYTKEEVDRKWYVVDANSKILGRMAARIAAYLRGKHKPIFTPNSDTGDFIVVVNAEKVKLTGDKLNKKMYYHHSNYPGGLKEESAKKRMGRRPELIIRDAVWGMLPKNRLGRMLIKKLKVYKGGAHPHEAQRPEAITL
jgi:large subunit ribosomal protein L13